MVLSNKPGSIVILVNVGASAGHDEWVVAVTMLTFVMLQRDFGENFKSEPSLLKRDTSFNMRRPRSSFFAPNSSCPAD